MNKHEEKIIVLEEKYAENVETSKCIKNTSFGYAHLIEKCETNEIKLIQNEPEYNI